MKKDNRIELYRFVAVLIIMIFHAGAFNSEQNHPIPLGHVFVEYFFFLTGYFTYRNVKNNIEKINISEYSFYYTFRKFKRFVPYVLMTVSMYIAVMFVGDRFIKNLAITDTIKKLTGIPFDVLLLQITGICQTPRFDHWWYLSALLFSLPIAVMLFYKNICSGGYTDTLFILPHF